MRRAVLTLFVVACACAGFVLGLRTNDAQVGLPLLRKTGEGAPSRDPAKIQKAPEERLGQALEAILAIGNRASTNRLGQYAALCAALENLDSEEIVQLLVKLDRMPASVRDLLMPLIVSWWGQRDPGAVTVWVQPTLARLQKQQNFMGMNAHDEALLEAWAVANPKAAFDYVREYPEHFELSGTLEFAIGALPGSYAARFAILKSVPDSAARRWVEPRFFMDWFYNDRRAALAAVSTLAPGKERDDALRTPLLYAGWATRNPTEALADLDAMGASNSSFSSLVVYQAAQGDPAAVARWLETEVAEAVTRDASTLISAWVGKDPAAAFAWGRDHGASPADRVKIDLHNGAQTQIQVAMEKNPEATLDWLQSVSPGRELDQYAELAARYTGSSDDCRALMAGASEDSAARIAASFEARLAAENPERAQEWAGSLEGQARTAAWTAFGQRNAGKDLPDLPVGPDRDAFLSGVANSNSGQPQKNAEAALQISDPQLRRQSFDDAISLWSE
ncbi:MAG TPA: hypothetical protein VGH90_04820, partial [Chthoniobacteraceae bacterium]